MLLIHCGSWGSPADFRQDVGAPWRSRQSTARLTKRQTDFHINTFGEFGVAS